MAGGARESLGSKAGHSNAGTTAPDTIPQSWSSRPGGRAAVSGKKLPVRCVQTMVLAAPACLSNRLEALDSSISGRMAFKSSVAETTGKSRTRAQPRSRYGRQRPNRCGLLARAGFHRQIQKAGTVSASHMMLSSSSIFGANKHYNKGLLPKSNGSADQSQPRPAEPRLPTSRKKPTGFRGSPRPRRRGSWQPGEKTLATAPPRMRGDQKRSGSNLSSRP